MLVYWIIWYCYCFQSGFKCTFQLYSSVFSISLYGCRYNVTLCIGRQHLFTVYRTGLGVCAVLVLSVIRCSCNYFFDRIIFHHDFHHDSCYYNWDFYGHSLHFELHFRLSVTKWFWFCKCTTPPPPMDILLEYWIEHVTFGLLYVMFTFLSRIFYRGVPGFATDWPCGVWCRGLTTCLLYVGPLFGNLVWNDRFVRFT